jgi:hypothetical protein
MKRETRIYKMVEGLIQADSVSGDYLDHVLRQGFRGFENMTDTELIIQYNKYLQTVKKQINLVP